MNTCGLGKLNCMACIIALCLVLIPFMQQSSANMIIPGGAKNGPYVDKLLFSVITQPNDEIESLLDDEIDIVTDMVDPSCIEMLSEADAVEIVEVPRNGYGYIIINCAKYPFNETSFRRALAFALDKQKISDQIWDGLANPLDSPVPDSNPFSIEGTLDYSYYESDTEEGNHLLDEAGFEINEETGFRMTPSGGDFSVTIEVPQSGYLGIEVGDIVVEALHALSIDAIRINTDFYDYLNRLYFHGDFDIVFVGRSFPDFKVDWLAYDFWSEYCDCPYWNFPNWRNSTYDSWRDQLLHSTTYEEIYEASAEMQSIWIYECPEIICYRDYYTSAYRTNRFSGFVNDAQCGPAGWWTAYKTHLKEDSGGPFGGTLRFSTPLDVDVFNFMASCSCHRYFNSYISWDSLMKEDAQGNLIPWLASDLQVETNFDNPNVPEATTRFTFQILPNASWSDGTPLTAYDVAYTMNFYRDAPGNPYSIDLSQMSAAYATTPWTVIIEFKGESYWHIYTIGSKYIIPKHVFEQIGVESWNTWNPSPPETPLVTSGPFNVSDYVSGAYLEMSYNPDYFYGFNRSSYNSGSPTFQADTAIIGATGIITTVGSIVVIVGVIILWKKKV